MHYLLSICFMFHVSRRLTASSSGGTALYIQKLVCVMRVYVDWLLAESRPKPIKTFTCLFQNCSWDLTGLLPYTVDCTHVTLTLTPTKYMMCNVHNVQVTATFYLVHRTVFCFSLFFVHILSVHTKVTTII
jgi:hypothetical protein